MTESIQIKLESKINKHLLLYNKFKELDFSSCVLEKFISETKDVYIETIEREDLRAMQKIFDNIYSDIDTILNNKDFWDELYVFPKKCKRNRTTRYDILDNSNSTNVINCNENSIHNFIVKLIQRASDNFENNFQNEKSRLLITGDVGVGKTTFFKYVYSKYKTTHFINNNVFWLHIDYTNINRRLQNYILFESIKQFRNNIYDNLNDEKKDNLRNYVSLKYQKIKDENFEKDYNDFTGYLNESREFSYADNLQYILMEYIESNYKTIYIIDGLDNINYNDKSFEIKIEDISDIIVNKKRKGMFLLVMRKITHDNIIEKLVDPLSAHNDLVLAINNIRKLEIKPVKLYDIIERRFKILINSWEQIIKNNKHEILNFENESEVEKKQKIENLIQKLKNKNIFNNNSISSYFKLFMLFIKHGIKPGYDIDLNSLETKDMLSEFKHLLGTNQRKLMDALKVSHNVFIEALQKKNILIEDILNICNLIEIEKETFLTRDAENDTAKKKFLSLFKRHYKVLPLLLQKSRYMHMFSYTIENEKIQIDINSIISKNIYSVYYPINAEKHTSIYNLLLKIRILQSLKIKNVDQKKDITRTELIEFIDRSFPYKKDEIAIGIQELIHFELIKLDYNKRNKYNLIIEKTGLNYLTKVIYDFTYLRIILDDMLYPKEFNQFFKDVEDKEILNNKSTWIIYQIPRVALFISLIENVESWDLSLLKNHKNVDQNNYNNWSISSDLRKYFYESVIRICRSDKEFNTLSIAFKSRFDLT